ncbi:MAG: hypothetical protein DMG25_18105 [Acidobacteria bacterium]|nr:MAG: hypothetical protein DMG25_18105 [Acidobacteriota bacterium]
MRRPILPKHRKSHGFHHLVILCIITVTITLCASSPAHGRTNQSRGVIGTGPKVAQAVRVERAPRLDGTLNDPLWQAAEPVRDFLQREPHEGQTPTETTEVRVLYTRREVYFGILCRDSAPNVIVATELRRDLPQDLDDNFEILIDSTHDRRNAYVFQMNPLGTQSDGLITEERRSEGQDYDPGWDGVWTSQAQITDAGWTATVGIPFNTLNFTQSQDVVWGLNFKRLIRRKNEEDLWSAYRRVFGITKVSEAGELRGITDIGSGRLFIVKPYGLLGADRLSTSGGTDFLHTGGVDIKYGLRSSLVANLTINTDFGDADVDQQQFNLTPYRIFFPEKRQFFLENAGVFDFSTGFQDLLFFSRQIGIDPVTGQVVPVNAGGKLTGTLGNYQIGVMDVQTRSDGPNPAVNYGVVRVKRSLFGNSYVGTMGINKESGSALDPFNRTGGVDSRLVFWKNLIVHGYGARTDSAGSHSGDSNVGIDVSYETNWLQFLARRSKIGPNYNPEVGFVDRVDSNQSEVDLNLRPRPKIRGVRELNFESFIFHAPDTQGVLQTQEWQTTFRAEFNNGAYTDDDIVDVFTQRLTQPFNIYKNINIPPGLYHFTRHQLTYGSGQDRRFTFNLFNRFGTYYDGHLIESSVRTNYRPTARFSLATTARWNKFSLPEGKFSVVLASAQANYSFSRFLTTSALIQMNTSNAQAVSANLRLRYNYRPDSDFYVIYNVGTRFASLAAANPQQLRETRFEVKYTYSFSPPRERIRKTQVTDPKEGL